MAAAAAAAGFSADGAALAVAVGAEVGLSADGAVLAAAQTAAAVVAVAAAALADLGVGVLQILPKWWEITSVTWSRSFWQRG